jgi:hypothetical protein
MNNTPAGTEPPAYFSLINMTLAGLGLYNILYWGAKFFGFFQTFYASIKEFWWLFLLFELLAVASVFVDTIVRWDKFTHYEKRVRLFLTSLFSIAFVLHFIIGYMEALMTGEVK